MSLVGFKAQNHAQQVGARGPLDEVDDRGTTAEMFAPLDARFRFTIDVAAADHNAKVDTYYTHQEDGLAQSWNGYRVWCNPPYSDLKAWVAKAWDEWGMPDRQHIVRPRPELIVMLVPSNRTEQRWWQEYVEPHRDRPGSPLRVEFLAGRPRFERPGAVIGPKGDRPPFGCCLLIWEQVTS